MLDKAVSICRVPAVDRERTSLKAMRYGRATHRENFKIRHDGGVVTKALLAEWYDADHHKRGRMSAQWQLFSYHPRSCIPARAHQLRQVFSRDRPEIDRRTGVAPATCSLVTLLPCTANGCHVGISVGVAVGVIVRRSSLPLGIYGVSEECDASLW